MTTMRERLCVAAVRAELTHAGATLPDSMLQTAAAAEEAVKVFGDFVDAILTELRTPDDAMLGAGMAHADTDLASEFTAMITHVLKS